MTKDQWRAFATSQRRALSEEKRTTESSLLARAILADPRWQRAHTVLLTLSFGSEWDTSPLFRAAWQAGKTVCLTRCLADHAMEVCRFSPETPLVTTRGSLREIPEDAAVPLAATDVDFCLVPGLLFDAYGTRLGYGAGYYDRFLPQLDKRCTILGCGFDCQLTGALLPAEPTDFRLSEVWTPSQKIFTRTPF